MACQWIHLGTGAVIRSQATHSSLHINLMASSESEKSGRSRDNLQMRFDISGTTASSVLTSLRGWPRRRVLWSRALIADRRHRRRMTTGGRWCFPCCLGGRVVLKQGEVEAVQPLPSPAPRLDLPSSLNPRRSDRLPSSLWSALGRLATHHLIPQCLHPSQH